MSVPRAIPELGSLPAGLDARAWEDALGAASLERHVVRLPGPRVEPLPVLGHDADGRVSIGCYAGDLTLDGRRLHLMPPMGMPLLSQWVRAAVERSVAEDLSGDDVTPLLGIIWAHAVDGASRHGPPAFRQDVLHMGPTVRGHLDVRRTVRLRAKGASDIASVYRGRILDNAVTRAIVAADRVLVRRIGHSRWRTDRLDDILPQLHVAVGRRAAVPGERELAAVRYSPITRPFKWAADLSMRIIRQDPVTTVARPGRVQGLLIDVLDIQRHAAMEWARATHAGLRFETVNGRGLVIVAPDGSRIGVDIADLPVDAREAAGTVQRAVASL